MQFSSTTIINQIHMVDYSHNYVEEPQVMMDHEKNSDLKVLMRRKDGENVGQAKVLMRRIYLWER